MDIETAIICASIGFLVNYFLLPVIRRISLKFETEKLHCFHHTHGSTVPRFGGVALALAFVCVTIYTTYALKEDLMGLGNESAIVLGAILMFSLGFLDDLFHLRAKWKFLGQIVISSAVYMLGVQIERFQVPFWEQTISLGVWGGVVTVLWLVSITNLINLIDGMDGLAAGVSLMLMGLLAFVGWQNGSSFSSFVAIGMGGALLGFLRHNFPPAKIYMGDGGAYFLGFLIAVLSIVNSQKGTVAAALTAPLIALALPILDVSWAVVRRGLKGLPIFRPDKHHIHHRLNKFGFSNRKTVLTLYSVSSFFLLMAFLAFWSQGRLVPIIFGLLCLVVIVSARSFGLIDAWSAIGKHVGSSLESRKAALYTLHLCRWFQMEAERANSINSLWSDYQFLLRKIGFTSAELYVHDQFRVWGNAPLMEEGIFHVTHNFNIGGPIILTLKVEGAGMNKVEFEILSELAAESLFKALSIWKKLHGEAVQIKNETEDNTEPVLMSERKDLTTLSQKIVGI